MKKDMTLPEIDLEELKKQKEQNFKNRLEFVIFYANWVKNTPNKKWSSDQKEFIDSVIKSLPTRK